MYSAGSRVDASYHASAGVQALRFLKRWQQAGDARRVDALNQVCVQEGVFIPGRFKRFYVSDPAHGERWLSPSDMLKADLSDLPLVSRKLTPSIDRLRLHKGWILLSRSGSIGNLAYTREDMDGLIGSDDIIRIVPNPDAIPSGYLYAFLNSTVGKSLIEQQTYGAVIQHIEAHHVTDLPIPRLDPATEQRIHEMIERAAALRVAANELLAGAQAQLFEAAGLPRLSNVEALTKGCWCFTVPSSQYGEFALTAWSYNPVTTKIVQRVQAGKYVELGEVVQPNGIFYGHRFSRIDADPSAGIMLLSQMDTFQMRPSGRWISKRSVADYREYIPADGTILVAAQGTMGDTELFGHCQFSHSNLQNHMVTEHILRIIPNPDQINPGYLVTFLSSEYGFQLFRSTARGTKLLGFMLGLVERIPIPIVSKSLEEDIGNKVYRAYDNRADALELEDEAQTLLLAALGWHDD
jgi:type I restriction enzyme S subunit